MHIFIQNLSNKSTSLNISPYESIINLKTRIYELEGIPIHHQRLIHGTKLLSNNDNNLYDYLIETDSIIRIHLSLYGGVDFQHREGSKPGSGGVMSESQANIDRRERLAKLAMETFDLSKDPYILKNHLGTFECKLCLTLHNNEGNYLAHTQGKRHQQNLARRAAKENRDAPLKTLQKTIVPIKRAIKIGRPGYKVIKSRVFSTNQRSLLFEIDYPEIDVNIQPRHRFMSSYEQKIEPPDRNYQYLLFACEPYETIAFKLPNNEIDKQEGKFITNWSPNNKKFTLQLHFKDDKTL